jgi:hypothetical protein
MAQSLLVLLSVLTVAVAVQDQRHWVKQLHRWRLSLKWLVAMVKSHLPRSIQSSLKRNKWKGKWGKKNDE